MIASLDDHRQRFEQQSSKLSSLKSGWNIAILANLALTTLPCWVEMPPLVSTALITPPSVLLAAGGLKRLKDLEYESWHYDRMKQKYINLQCGSDDSEQQLWEKRGQVMVESAFEPEQPAPIAPTDEEIEFARICKVFDVYGKVKIGIKDKLYREDGTVYLLGRAPGTSIDSVIDACKKIQRELRCDCSMPGAVVEDEIGGLFLRVLDPANQVKTPIQAREAEFEPVEYQESEQPKSISFEIQRPNPGHPINVGNHERVQSKTEQIESRESEVFTKFLKAPHNWICGKTNGGKTFLTLRLVWDWINANPDGEIIICDRNFGKPDRETGEIFDWNGMDPRVIYVSDDEIMSVLDDQAQKLINDMNRFSDYARRRSMARREGKPFDEPQPEKRKVLIIVTEWNALVDSTKAGRKLESSPCVGSIAPILQQGNGYGIKLILDGQSIAVGLSGISEALRMQTSICMVGDNCTNPDEVSQLASGETGKQLISQCSELKRQGKRACIIQLGEGAPVAAIVPHMAYLRDPEYRFDGYSVNIDTESPEIEAFDQIIEEKYNIDVDEALDDQDDDGDPWDNKLEGNDPYEAIINWIRTNHPERINEKAFPTNLELNELWLQWFKQNGKTISPLTSGGLDQLRKILNEKRGLS